MSVYQPGTGQSKDNRPCCARCGRALSSTISRGSHPRQPFKGFCGMCAREMKDVALNKGEDES